MAPALGQRFFYKAPKASYLVQGRRRGGCGGSDNHRCGQASSKRYRWRHAVDLDSNGNPLGKPHPRINSLDRGQALGADGCIWCTDSAGYALDMPRQFLLKSHKLNFSGITDLKAPKFRLLEIASHPI